MSLSENFQERPPVGNMADYVHGVKKDSPLHLEVSIQDSGRVIVFHDKKFKNKVSWFEYSLNNSQLDFIMDDGQKRDFGMPLDPSVAKHMHNAHQILMVYLDSDTGEAVEGNYIPLLINSA